MNKINRLGNCPSCGASWKGDSILDEINSLSVFKNRSNRDVLNIATSYGYNGDNTVTFSKTISIQIEGRHLIKCPEMKCGAIFDIETGEQFNTIEEAISPKEIDKIEENDT